MDRWARDRRAEAGDSTGGPGEDPPSLPPLHLDSGATTDTLPADEHPAASDSKPWQRWSAIGLALVVGVLAGALGANARDEAASQNQVSLVAGEVVVMGAPYISGDAPVPLRVELFNAGRREVEILGMDLDGWLVVDDHEPTTLEPGGWQTVLLNATAECVADDGGLGVRALVRTGSGEHTVRVDAAPNQPWLTEMQVWACRQPFTHAPPVDVVGVRALPREPGAETLTTELMLTTGDDGTAYVTDAQPLVPGLGYSVRGLPAEVARGRPARIEVEWTIGDCAQAEEFQGVTLVVSVAADSDAVSQQQSLSFPESGHLPLLRLIADACPA